MKTEKRYRGMKIISNDRSESGDLEIHDADGCVRSCQSFQTAERIIDRWKKNKIKKATN